MRMRRRKRKSERERERWRDGGSESEYGSERRAKTEGKALDFDAVIMVITKQRTTHHRASQGRPFLPLLPWSHGSKQPAS